MFTSSIRFAICGKVGVLDSSEKAGWRCRNSHLSGGEEGDKDGRLGEHHLEQCIKSNIGVSGWK